MNFRQSIRIVAAAFTSLWIVSIVRAADLTTQPVTDAATQPAPQTSAPTSKPSTQASSISLNFKDAPLDKVLDLLSKSMGFSVMTEGPVDGHVTLLSRQPVSADEAVTMLNAALKSNGFTVIREGRLLRIIPSEKARKGNVPVHFGNKVQDIADTDELITQVIPITSVSATKLRDDLKPMMSADVDIAANDGSNSIIITDTSASVRRIVEIISRLDDHEASTAELKIVQLKHADATQTAKLIDGLFKTDAAAPAMDPRQRMMMQQQGQAPPPEPSEHHGDHVVTAADARTNTLVVVASRPTLKMIDDLLLTIDSDNPNPAPPAEITAFPLKYADAEETAKIVTNIFKAPKADTGFPFIIRFSDEEEQKKTEVPVNAISDARTNTVIVTAPHEKLAAVQKLIGELDAHPMTSGGIRVMHLKYADADNISLLIEDMFKPKAGEAAPRNPFLDFFDEMPEEKPPTRDAKVTVTSDGRTNTLIVGAPTDLLDVIEHIVRELDADPTTADTMFIYHLRNSQAANLETVLNTLFGNNNNNQQNNQQGQPGQAGQNAQQMNQQNSQGNSNLGSRDTQSSSTIGNQNRTGNQSRNRASQSSLRRLTPSNAQAITELTGKVFVVADLDTNALLVTTATKFEKQVRKIIDDLDQPVPQVLIKVLIAEVTHDNSSDTGLDFSVLNIRPSGRGTSAGQAFGDAAAAATAGGLVVSVLESNISATLHALATAGKLDVLSRPYILASDNQEASITVGESVPFVTDSRIDQNNNTINTVEYRDIGILLDVTPHINPDGLVILDVSPEISSMTNTTIQLSPGVASPVFQQRSAQSHVAIMNGHTIVIGGLMQDQKTATITKVPIFGDIPFIGRAFQRRQLDKTKTELLIFLTPHVALSPDALPPMSADEINGTRLTPRAVGPGVFDEHLRGLRRGGNPQTKPTQPISPIDSIDLGDSGEQAPTGQPTNVPPTPNTN